MVSEKKNVFFWAMKIPNNIWYISRLSACPRCLVSTWNPSFTPGYLYLKKCQTPTIQVLYLSTHIHQEISLPPPHHKCPPGFLYKSKKFSLKPYLPRGGAHCAPPVTYLRISVQIRVRARWKNLTFLSYEFGKGQHTFYPVKLSCFLEKK